MQHSIHSSFAKVLKANLILKLFEPLLLFPKLYVFNYFSKTLTRTAVNRLQCTFSSSKTLVSMVENIIDSGHI